MVSQPLADDTLKQLVGTLVIFHAERNAIVVAEVELRKVAVQVVMGAVLIDALHAALEHGEKALHGVGVELRILRADVFLPAVVYNVVPGELPAKQGVVGSLIGHEMCFARKVLEDDRGDGRNLHVVHYEATGLPALAVNEGQDFVFVVEATATLLTLRLDGLVMADIGFVGFHVAATLTELEEVELVAAHGFADAVRHEPRALEADPERAVKLVAAHALLAAGDQEDGLEPDVERDMAGFEDGPDSDPVRLAAVPALVDPKAGGLALELHAIPDHPALGADGLAVRPEAGFYEVIGGGFVVEVRGGEDGHLATP